MDYGIIGWSKDRGFEVKDSFLLREGVGHIFLWAGISDGEI